VILEVFVFVLDGLIINYGWQGVQYQMIQGLQRRDPFLETWPLTGQRTEAAHQIGSL
jgi:hypothetical protein